MAVNVDEIDLIAARTAEAYKEAELEILGIIKRHLEQGIDRPTWADERLAAVVSLRRAAQQVIKRLATGDPGIRASVLAAYRNGRGGAVIDLPGDQGDAARAARRQVPQTAAIDSLANALIRDVGERRRNVLRNVEDIYRQTQAAAVARLLAANITRREASQAAWQGFVDQGVTSFTDRANRVWRLTTYVEMAMRTVAMRAAVQGQVDQLTAMGRDLVVVSNEAGECPRCRPWEGKVLSITDRPGARVLFVDSITTAAEPRTAMTAVPATRAAEAALVRVEVAGSLAEAMLAGLLHPNCGHTIRAYLPGATRLPTAPTEDPDHNKAKVRQRQIEREIRKHKEREAAALTPEAKREAAAKTRQWQAVMRAHLKANPKLKRLEYREQIGAGNLPPGGTAPSPAGRLTGPPPPGKPPRKTTGPKKATPAKKAAPAKATKKAPSAGTRLDTSRRRAGGDIETEARQRIYELDNARMNSDYGDPGLTALVRFQPGWAEPARVVSQAQLDTVISRGWTQLWRGAGEGWPDPLPARQVGDLMRTGPWKMGEGIYGNGFYASPRRTTAEVYRNNEPDQGAWGPGNEWVGSFAPTSPGGKGALVRMAIDPSARLADYDTLTRELADWLKRQSGTVPEWRSNMTDIGWFAVMRGYDGIVVRARPGINDGAAYPPGVGNVAEADQYVIFNRSVLMMERDDGQYDS